MMTESRLWLQLAFCLMLLACSPHAEPIAGAAATTPEPVESGEEGQKPMKVEDLDGETGGSEGEQSSATGEVFSMGTEESIRTNTGLSLSFLEVVQDSRCPKGVQCMWEGEVVVEVAANHQSDESLLTFRLRASSERATLPFAEHLVHLEGVDPYPIADRPIESRDYVARVRVESNELAKSDEAGDPLS